MSHSRVHRPKLRILFSIPPRLSQTRTMCSLTPNAAATMTSYPQAALPPRGPATLTHQATFSACFPAYSLALAAPQSNRGRDPTRITSLATYSKTYVFFFFPYPYPHSPSKVGGCAQGPLIFIFCCSFYDQRSSGIARCGPG